MIEPVINHTHLDHNHVFVMILSGLFITYYIISIIAALVALAYCVADSEDGSINMDRILNLFMNNMKLSIFVKRRRYYF